ncbi:hypothetical protein OGATHE_004895, partial [Ogataea polymorpha]
YQRVYLASTATQQYCPFQNDAGDLSVQNEQDLHKYTSSTGAGPETSVTGAVALEIGIVHESGPEIQYPAACETNREKRRFQTVEKLNLFQIANFSANHGSSR